MEGRSRDSAVGAVSDRGARNAVGIPSRRTAAIGILTRALMSPPHSGQTTKDNAQVTANANDEGVTSVAAAATAARSFLDQTCSVYVLDADTSSTTNSTITNAPGGPTISNTIQNHGTSNMPKIFGCWNFLHQAMNEIERFEEERQQLVLLHQRKLTGSTNLGVPLPLELLSETRLLAEFAVKVARRSDELDRRKVATCVENFCSSKVSSKPAVVIGDSEENAAVSNSEKDETTSKGGDSMQREGVPQSNNDNDATNGNNISILLSELVRANAEIREIVTGRIAAFSFNNNSNNVVTEVISQSPVAPAPLTSALEDPVVVETFCKFLAANAVSNGPERLRRFLNDWIIPGATAGSDTPTSVTNNDYNRIGVDDGGDGDNFRSNSNDSSKRQRVSPSNKRLLHHRLPPYSLACVLHHVAAESEITTKGPSMLPVFASKGTANETNACTLSPCGTIDVLQRLSMTVMANVLLGPVLHDALNRKQLKRQLIQHRPQQESFVGDEDEDDRIIAMGLKAVATWCATTDLSLAQTKHIGSKVRINLLHILGEALNTESPKVMSALADLIEDVVERHVVPLHPSQLRQRQPLISEARMTQTRYLMQVPDEESFRANVSEEQLHVIETKELSDILRQISADVERQRYRFPLFGGTHKNVTTARTEQQPNSAHGEIHFDDRTHSLGHSLARIAAAVCGGYAKVVQSDVATTGVPDTAASIYDIHSTGLLELLSKCASHPSVSICAIVLPVVTPILRMEVGLATEWLPTLQRRAIIPHHPKSTSLLSSSNIANKTSDIEYSPLLNASDISFVEFEEFIDRFRNTVLADALNACYRVHSEYYLASCTAAIEEFCAGDVATEQTSFHLEAALFCLSVVSEQVLPSVLATEDSKNSSIPTTTGKAGNKMITNASSYLLRCTAALAKKPKSLGNPLTMAQACRFLRKHASWFGSNRHPGVLDIATDLTLFILSQCATSFPDTALSSTIRAETGVTPYSEAAKTLRCLLSNNAKHFLSNKAIAALGAGWESTFAACNRSGKLLTLEDRKNTCIGICHVLAALPKDQQQTSLMALALASIACLETMVKGVDSVVFSTENKTISSMLDRAADEIIILATTARAFTDATSLLSTGIGNDRDALVEPAMAILRRAWPSISIVASQYSSHDSTLEALGFLFAECIPAGGKHSDNSTEFLKDTCALAKSVFENDNARQNISFFSPALQLVEASFQTNATTFEAIARSKQNDGGYTNVQDHDVSHTFSEKDERVYQYIDLLTRESITTMGNNCLLGSAWTKEEKQGNGQSAFESKTKLQYDNAGVLTVGLGMLFSTLYIGTKLCPTFLFHILEGGADENSPILRRALESAVSSIICSEAETSLKAIAFLKSAVVLATNAPASNDGNMLTLEYSDDFKARILSTILRGICGVFQPVVLPDACRLFSLSLSSSNLSTEKLRMLFLRSLSHEHFFLGDKAWKIMYDFCLLHRKRIIAGDNDNEGNATSTTGSSSEDIQNMMTVVWQLHRFENIDAIETSDVVNSFCIRYGPKEKD